jgi:uncharacterized damage-inducible protein DinB
MADKAMLAVCLDQLHEAVLWKLEGLSERQVRQPMTPTGSNLLGIVKHLGTAEFGYFGVVFGRPTDEPMPWGDFRDNRHMYAEADQDSTWVKAFYCRANAHTAATIAALDLDSPGLVPWWLPESRTVTLGRILVHLIAETGRHAGHMDIIRELIDGQTGTSQANAGATDQDPARWAAYVEDLQRLADEA